MRKKYIIRTILEKNNGLIEYSKSFRMTLTRPRRPSYWGETEGLASAQLVDLLTKVRVKNTNVIVWIALWNELQELGHYFLLVLYITVLTHESSGCNTRCVHHFQKLDFHRRVIYSSVRNTQSNVLIFFHTSFCLSLNMIGKTTTAWEHIEGNE